MSTVWSRKGITPTTQIVHAARLGAGLGPLRNSETAMAGGRPADVGSLRLRVLI